MDNCFILGVTGGSGSGKTFFAENLAKKLGQENCFILHQDSYYIDQADKFDHDGGSVNFDHPDALDFDLLTEHLKQLKEEQEIEIPIYDFVTHSRKKEKRKQPPKKVIILDGTLILTQDKLRNYLDKSIFVHTPEEIRYQRRLLRDVEERGRTPEGVKAQFETQVKPMHDLFVEPSKSHADMVSSGTQVDKLNQVFLELNDII